MKKNLLLIALAITTFAFTACEPQTEKIVPKKYTIEQFIDNETVIGGVFSRDESKLLISSNESGRFNAYEINAETGDKEQVTFSESESYFVLCYVPETDNIIFSADSGGNEISHLYLLNRSDSSTTNLTPYSGAKTAFMGWSNDESHFYFLCNKRNPQFFDLYKMEFGVWEPKLLYENTMGLSVTGVSKDEKYVTLIQSITTSENKLFLCKIEDGQMIEISDSTKAANYKPSGFGDDLNSFYYITNNEGEFAHLAKYNIETQEHTIEYKTDWDVAYFYFSETEKFKVIGINEDGRNKLIVKETATNKDVVFPDLKDANVLGVFIAKSETRMRLTVGTSKSPSDIYVYNFENNEIKRLTKSLNPEIDETYLVSAEVVRYPSFDNLEIPAIYYKPHVASSANKVPGLIWVHGGPGGQSRVGYSTLIQYLVNHGYAVLAVNNRGSSGYGKSFYKMDDLNHGDKDLKDCIYGKKYLQSLDYIDTSKIGIIGGSYGGYMTMAAMTFTPDEFKTGVNIVGVTNWLRTLRSIPPYWEAFRNALYKELGDPNTDDSVRLYNISPLFHAHNIKNPVMVLQGANDPRVLRIESDEIVAAMKENNIPVEYLIFSDEGHGFMKKENQIEGYSSILSFLDKYLKELEEQPIVENE